MSNYYVYSLNLEDGKKYIGMTSNPEKRIADHINGKGAQFTQKNKVVSVNHINQCSSKKAAQNAERIVYYNMKKYHGTKKVRGAGYTKST